MAAARPAWQDPMLEEGGGTVVSLPTLESHAVARRDSEKDRRLVEQLAWDFRALDPGRTGQLSMSSALILMKSSEGHRLSHQQWEKFASRHRKEVGFERGHRLDPGVGLDEIYSSLIHWSPDNDDQLTVGDLLDCSRAEREQVRAAGLEEYHALRDMLDDGEKAAQPTPLKGRELREAALRRLAALLPDSPAKKPVAEKLSGRSSVTSQSDFSAHVQHNGDASLLDALESKYSSLVSALLRSATRASSLGYHDFNAMHSQIMRLYRAGRLDVDELSPLLGDCRSLPDLWALMGKVSPPDAQASSTVKSTYLGHESDFLAVSDVVSTLTELRLRQSQEHTAIMTWLESSPHISEALSLVILEHQAMLAGREQRFECAALVVGIGERLHRPGTLLR